MLTYRSKIPRSGTGGGWIPKFSGIFLVQRYTSGKH